MLTVAKGTQGFDQTFPSFLRDPFQAGGQPQKTAAWRKLCCRWKRNSKGTREKRSLILGVLDACGREGKPVQWYLVFAREAFGQAALKGGRAAVCFLWCSTGGVC